MKPFPTMLALLALSAAQALAGPLTIGALMADPAFAGLSPEQRLASLNRQLEAKTLKSSDIGGDLTSRLMMDAIVVETDPTKRLARYAELRAANPKLPNTFELEQSLAVQLLASDPGTQGADELERLRILLRMENAKQISWPAAAPLYTGMLGFHLSRNPEYQAMSPQDKIKYVRRLTAEGVVKDMTSNVFIRGVGWEYLSSLPPDVQAKALKDMEPGLDFFSKSGLQKGYAD